jgi:hypothetical protein
MPPVLVTVIACRITFVTVSAKGPLVIPLSVAVMLVVLDTLADTTPVAKPPGVVMVAAAVFDDAHAALDVQSVDDPFE